MYSFILLLVGIFWLTYLKSVLVKISANSAFLFANLVILLFLIYAWQILTYSPLHNSEYFSLLSSDGERYLNEAKLFSFPWHLNELEGQYISDTVVYAATPKMGLSGYLSILSFGWTPDLATAYAMLMFGVVITGYIKLKIIDCFKISAGAKIVLALVVVLFPTDLYFSVRFLREPIANDLFIIGLLIICLYQFKGRHAEKFIKILPMVIAALILWRVQLAAVLSISSLLLLPFSLRALTIIIPLLLLSLLQMVRAFDVLSLAVRLESDLVYSFFMAVKRSKEVLSIFDGAAFVLPLLMSILTPLNFKNRYVSSTRFKLCAVGVVVPWLLADLGQIRFVYPAIMWLKALFCMLFLHQFRFSLGKAKPVRKIPVPT